MYQIFELRKERSPYNGVSFDYYHGMFEEFYLGRRNAEKRVIELLEEDDDPERFIIKEIIPNDLEM